MKLKEKNQEETKGQTKITKTQSKPTLTRPLSGSLAGGLSKYVQVKERRGLQRQGLVKGR